MSILIQAPIIFHSVSLKLQVISLFLSKQSLHDESLIALSTLINRDEFLFFFFFLRHLEFAELELLHYVLVTEFRCVLQKGYDTCSAVKYRCLFILWKCTLRNMSFLTDFDSDI